LRSLRPARALKPNFELSKSNAAAVAGICAQLDGLPLAIELAAARLRLLSPEAILSHLQHRLGLLIDGPCDLPSRQRTLRGTMQWSYDLLGSGEQVLFRRLAVFAGGASLEFIENVCYAPDESKPDLIAGLESLVAKSLLLSDGVKSPRVRMLETIREYALE
jgi:predicted ATPase